MFVRLRYHRLRGGFTLIELLVVIAILAILMTITALFFPTFDTSRKVSSGADQLSGWLLISKQRARRDGVPTGLRLTVTKANNFCSTVNYIQQPDDVAIGSLTITGNNPNSATITVPAGVSLTSSAGGYQVQVGDYLEVNGGGLLHRITGIAQGAAANLFIVSFNRTTPPVPDVTAPTNGKPNYRIIRQAQVISGEQPLKLPDIVAIDFNTHAQNGGKTLSLNVPKSLAAATATDTYYDILFAPSGAVVSPGATSNQIYLFVRSIGTQSNPVSNTSDILAGDATLIVVQPRTGFIANHPVSSNGNPYLFAQDGRSSGL
jgi:prepilin-type N-terminal cleavage/methylation domain-containing protein